MRARKADVEPYGPLVVDDRSSNIRRRTRLAFGLESHAKLDTMELAGIVAKIIDDESPVKVFIDVNGLGAGTYDRLKERGYGRVIRQRMSKAALRRRLPSNIVPVASTGSRVFGSQAREERRVGP